MLNAMINELEDPLLMHNGCLILCQFQIPSDVMFDFKKLVIILLHIVSETSSQESFNQLAGIYLLNNFVCQVDSEVKLLVGSMGAVERMLEIIMEKLERAQIIVQQLSSQVYRHAEPAAKEEPGSELEESGASVRSRK